MKRQFILINVGALLLSGKVSADVYLHNPRGSNDRNCERNANRNNESEKQISPFFISTLKQKFNIELFLDRLFDSQNNNAGGYACPRGVGDESFQSEMGIHVWQYLLLTDDNFVYLKMKSQRMKSFRTFVFQTFQSVDIATSQTVSFTQEKRMYYYEGSILPIEWTDQHG